MFLANALDEVAFEINISPVFISNDNTNFQSKLNAFQDHGWNGAYTSQERKSMFPAIVEVD